MLTRRTLKLKQTFSFTDPNKLSSMFSNNTQQSHSLSKKNIGHWKAQEQTAYFIFLKENREKFGDREVRRSEKIFREMAKAIKSRGADQCRSHHQKMVKKYPEFDGLLEYLRKNYGEFEEEVLRERAREEEELRNPSVDADFSSENMVQELVEKEDEPQKEELGEAQETLQQQRPQQTPQALAVVNEDNFDLMSLMSFDAIHELEKCGQPAPLLADQLFQQACIVPYF